MNEETWADADKAQSAYDKSKTLSEKAAWDFMGEQPGLLSPLPYMA